MSRVEPERNRYVGHRYVPKIFGEWNQQNEYEGLSIVTYQGTSYTSKKRVPVGIDILNEEFWVVTGNYNTQVEEYRQEVRRLGEYVDTEVKEIKNDLTGLSGGLTELSGEVTDLRGDVNSNSDTLSSHNERLLPLEQYLDPSIDKITINIPGDFNTLQSAVDHSLTVKNGVQVEIMIQSGFNISRGLFLQDKDASHVIISSEDDTVPVSNNFTGDLIRVFRSKSPVINCLFDMKGLGSRGMHVDHSAEANITSRGGVINAGTDALYVRTATVTAPFSTWTGANGRAVWVTRSASVSLGSADVSGAKGDVGVYVSRASILEMADCNISNMQVSRHAVQCLRSKMTLLGADLSNSLSGGILVGGGSEVTLRGANVTDCGESAIEVNGGKLAMGTATDVSRAGNHGIHCYNAGNVSGISCIANNCGGSALIVEGASSVSLKDSTYNDSRSENAGVYVTNGSNVDISNSNIRRSTGHGLYVNRASHVDTGYAFIVDSKGDGIRALNSSVVSALNTRSTQSVGVGVNAQSGSTIACRNAEIKGSGANDLLIQYGGTISCNNASTTNGTNNPVVGDTNVTSFNEVSNRGIIYV